MESKSFADAFTHTISTADLEKLEQAMFNVREVARMQLSLIDQCDKNMQHDKVVHYVGQLARRTAAVTILSQQVAAEAQDGLARLDSQQFVRLNDLVDDVKKISADLAAVGMSLECH
jgi:hypothetical protein